MRQSAAMAKTVTMDQLKRILIRLPENPRILLSGNAATPLTVLDLIEASLETVTLNLLNAIHPMPRRDGVTLETIFVGPGMRGAENLRYVPCRLSMLPLLLWHSMRPDAVILHTSTPRSGAVSLGIEVNVLPAAIEATGTRGGVVIAVTNPNMPHTRGDAVIDLDEIDYLVEVEEPIMAPEPVAPDADSERIGQLISEQIRDGATLQLGIGAVPNAVIHSITTAHGLRIWSETVSDGVLALELAGALDPDVPIRASFMIGTEALYGFADDNPRVVMVRTERCNSPAQIAKHYSMTSVNAALQVDLHGQANASRVRQRIYSGFGGSTDFIIGALHAPGGQSFMALPSWHPRANTSTIVPYLDGPATSFQQSAVVTEQGIAWIFGSSERDQATHLIEKAAHPDARDQLREAAALMQLG